MTIRIPTIKEWFPLTEPLPLYLREHETQRKVVINANTTEKTAFHFHWEEMDADGVVQKRLVLLAVIDGFKPFEFTIPASGQMLASTQTPAGEVWLRTDDGVQYQLEQPIAEGYAEPYIRKERNHAQELMMFQAQQNMMRREQRLAATIERFEQKRAEEEAARDNKKPKPAKSATGDAKKPVGEAGGKDKAATESAAEKAKPKGGEDGSQTPAAK